MAKTTRFKGMDLPYLDPTKKTSNLPSNMPKDIPGGTLPGKYSNKTPLATLPNDPNISRVASQHLMNLAATPGFDMDISSDEEDARPELVTVENLPAVVNNTLTADTKFSPEWYQVAKLPGNIRNGIRELGKRLFSQFTNVPTDKIWQMSTVTNPALEVKAVFAWIKQHAHKVDDVDIDFTSMPGYRADIELWAQAGVEFLLVKDFAGYYIYSWPTNNTIAGPESPSMAGMIECAKSLVTKGYSLKEALDDVLTEHFLSMREGAGEK